MWTKEILFSSDKQDWSTPQALFDEVNKEFAFTLDAAADETNAKCESFLTEKDDALVCDWPGVVWLNPPYGRGVGRWVEKAYEQSKMGSTVVCLIFCRTDTKWWHRWAMKAAEIRLIPGRISFGAARGGAPAPSCLLVFDDNRRVPRFLTQELPRR